jgi:hypothetical protein
MAEFVWINSYVALGPSSKYGGPTVAELAEMGMSVLIDLNADPSEREMASKHGIEYWGEYVQDGTAPSQAQLFKIAQVISRAVSRGRKVYVHCSAGIGRSPTCVAAYLIVAGETLDAARKLVKSKRTNAWTDGVAGAQQRSLEDFERTVGRMSGERPPGK